MFLFSRTGGVQRIHELNQFHDPMMYVLLFPDGKPGFQLYMKKDNDKDVTPRQYYAYHIHDRKDSFNPVLFTTAPQTNF